MTMIAVMMITDDVGPVFDWQKAKGQLSSSLEQLYVKAVTDLASPEAVAEHSSLTLETARSHKMVRHRLCDESRDAWPL